VSQAPSSQSPEPSHNQQDLHRTSLNAHPKRFLLEQVELESRGK